ncbi:cyclopropane-fatty-acyl-phospholipid synthase [Vibrio breoganii]|uniref:Cyclopropane-fatty-acyl-phospholipid synthase n=1 Tax=Vibrio breoganii TaxID=553239 RepID=A0AAN0XV77_9VIBR|nr:cyclopropane-fatty-acyl-phospholipid synthase family protein [Vibrio breoganii]ANO33191.1 cyclopropane-fatty-acyl-phospholipid synthase [Vibrio breoganii]OED90136.1 cyclopropane-fatty-acyl-phospholipid synthase [Vibrio breoganii ZF-55]PMG86375.1 cyclopropane-fatty-acyl-phospholipid synthase [Vibrio breoganii]PMK40240.1 cyclopropane-fatty-acyl-phospholipid synthase [Vibrio breoganii]PMO53883.1 cyclopropane-fatty-acyl-phospholipid synthase [Vibrio breoganii]
MYDSQSLVIEKDLSPLQRSARALLLNHLQKLQHGRLTIIERFESKSVSESLEFGCATESFHASIEISHPDFYSRMLSGGSIAAAEAYMDGWWDSSDLTAVMKLMALNLNSLDNMNSKQSLFKRAAYKVGHWLNRNTHINSKKNIGAHYDLGNELYTRFLDNNMLYSAAVYNNSSDTLEQAQINKMDRLCQQLKLQSGDSVIEIGTGWGGMAIYMAKTYGCHVTTTTISEEQFAYAAQKVQEQGLSDQVTLLKQDYRDLEGQFDKLVSIEMIEAVGREFLPSYIDKCQSLLKPGGLMAIQAITIADQRFESYSKGVDFIQKYIFPGGFLPSVTHLLQQTTKHSQLVLHDLHDIGMDYAKTLREWLHRFNLSEKELASFGYDERFMRMWRYYLCYCEGGFLAQRISTVHLTFRNPK